MNVTLFQDISSVLLEKHYGLELNDTHLWDTSIVAECIKQGFRPYQVVAEHAEEADLGRIDKMDYGVPSKAAITADDEAAALEQLKTSGFETADA